MSTPYLMENDDEVRRLEMKTDAFVVEAQARRAGLVPGMRVADMFCGAGLTTAVLSRLTTPGETIGVDGSPERIEHAECKYAGPATRFVCRDIRQDLSDLGPFDFVWIRFALEYFLAEAFSIVENITKVIKPGGILCLIDLDHNGVNHYGIPPRLDRAIAASMRQLEEQANFDPFAGRKLYSHLYRLGYRDIQAEAGAHHLIYGPLREADSFNWIKKIEVVSRKVRLDLPGYGSPEEFLEDFKLYFSDPGRFTYTPVIACWGKKKAD